MAFGLQNSTYYLPLTTYYLLPMLPLLFLLSEILLAIFKKSQKQETKENADRSSLRMLWLVILSSVAISVFLMFQFPRGAEYACVGKIGSVIMFVGLILRWTAIIQLGKSFTVDVAIGKSQQVMQSGLYGIVRHPSYTGLLLLFFGLSLYFNTWFAIPVINIPVIIALSYRIRIEEEALTRHFGDAYTAYCRKVKRVIPFVW